MNHGEQITGTPDLTFNLVSLLYHSLNASQACEKYMKDAEHMGEKELSAFFQEIALAEKQRAERLKPFLAKALKGYAPKDLVEHSSKASFPASDAPAHL